jgi:pyruvate-ferredoxin/flavodoxin oxidoreductase
MDGNEAAAHVAYKTSEVIAIYPITPSSPMGELADQWSAEGRPNLWGEVPRVVEMQSEGGAAGALHGALQAGSLATTFTASQGLLLMIPNMYKMAGELTSTVFHVAARSLATHALSIFGDHSDVMAARSTGWAQLFASSVQEVMDFSLVATASTLRSRVPFLHVFDGFRTSHELNRVWMLTDEQILALVDEEMVREHRRRALSPDHPVVRGTAQNPDVFFQGREAANPYYEACPGVVQELMDRFASLTGRSYHLFDYVGHPQAERVIVIMGSGAQAVEETVRAMQEEGQAVGLVKVRLYRPFSAPHFLAVLPASTRVLAVLDRTREPGAPGEPLYQDVSVAVLEGNQAGRTPPRVIGGRYGLSSKEFTPAMVRGIFAEMERPQPRNHFTVGIRDDVGGKSLDYDPDYILEDPESIRAVFWGLGSDGTVSANKNSIKIIGEETDLYVQGYFVYDSKKAGARTVSHLRFGPRPLERPYLIQRATFVACHQFDFLFRYPVLDCAEPGATFLLNSPYSAEEVWDHLPRPVQQQILDKRLRFYVVDAESLARLTGLGGRINTIMQTCFFALGGVLPRPLAVQKIKESIRKTYGSRGQKVVATNFAAVDSALAHLEKVDVVGRRADGPPLPEVVPPHAPPFVRQVTAEILAERGDQLPVSAMPVDGTFPSGTARWEKRNLATQVPVWEPELCIQCGKCVMVCPHAVIRSKIFPPQALEGAPPTFKSHPAHWKELKEERYSLQVSVEDCTGCQLCVEICPVKDKADPRRKALNMALQRPLRERERANWEFFLSLPDHYGQDRLRMRSVKDVQLLQPLFEFSGACAGCGETPYLKLVSQLFGERALIANATGCSSIYGGNLPTTPWTVNREGRGPAWSNSLFEDNAEFGMGMRLALDTQERYARQLLERLRPSLGEELVEALLAPAGRSAEDLAGRRLLLERLKEALRGVEGKEARDLEIVCEVLLPRSVWIVGGDGWAYDIGYGGLDHVLASGLDVNVLVLDTEVYSNTGGQASKATPMGAVARFAAAGKPAGKKDLGRMAMAYGNVYVAQVAMGASDTQTLQALMEAEAHPGPSLVIAYSHCIAHGIDISRGLAQQKLAVDSGQWLLYRYDPGRRARGENPLVLDCKAPKIPVREYLLNEGRFRHLANSDPQAAERALARIQEEVDRRWQLYSQMAAGGTPA